MMGKARHIISTLGALLAALPLVACQVMNSSQSYQLLEDGTTAQTCTSGLGSYALPYSTIKVKVWQHYAVNSNEPLGNSLFSISGTVERHADPKHRYCLDFLESIASDDTVGVYFGESAKDQLNKNASAAVPLTALEPATQQQGSSGLLSLVVSKSVDQTGEAILRLLRAIFIFVSRNASFDIDRADLNPEQKPRLMTEQDVDPFNLQAMANLNVDLRKYGLCVTMGKYSHSESMSAEAYCNNPKRALDGDGLPLDTIIAKRQRRLTETKPTGVLYRPRQNYSLYVYGKDDPQIEKGWKLLQIETVALENLSPVMSIEVKRAMFAEHRVALAFDQGNLFDVCIAKGSELAGAIKIPVNVLFGLVSLPAQTIEAELDRLSNKAELLNAQKKVIEAQEAYIQQIKANVGNERVAEFKDDKPLSLGSGGDKFVEPKVSDAVEPIGRIAEAAKIPVGFCKLIENGG